MRKMFSEKQIEKMIDSSIEEVIKEHTPDSESPIIFIEQEGDESSVRVELINGKIYIVNHDYDFDVYSEQLLAVASGSTSIDSFDGLESSPEERFFEVVGSGSTCFLFLNGVIIELSTAI